FFPGMVHCPSSGGESVCCAVGVNCAEHGSASTSHANDRANPRRAFIACFPRVRESGCEKYRRRSISCCAQYCAIAATQEFRKYRRASRVIHLPPRRTLWDVSIRVGTDKRPVSAERRKFSCRDPSATP